MLNEETIENYKRVEKLVRDKFELTDESNELFSKLLFNPEDAIEFEKIASQPDRRLFVEADSAIYEEEDPTWRSFRAFFPKLFEKNKISYKDYISGKVGDKKIITILVEYIIQEQSGFIEMLNLLNIKDSGTFRKVIYKYFPKNCEKILEYTAIKYLSDGEKICVKVGKKTFKKNFNTKEVANVIKGIKAEFSNIVNTSFFGIRKTSSTCICFSLNYADWLLASTKENWSSCIGLENDNGYWRGLSGLVGDKNRLLVFMTNKEEKNFRGIKSYRMLERCWVFLYKDFMEKKYISSNRLYPKKQMPLNLEPHMELFSNGVIYKRDLEEATYTSLYTFPTIFYKPLTKEQLFVSSSIYEDTHVKKVCELDISKSYYTTFDESNGTSCLAFMKDGSIKYTEYKSGAIK